MALLQVRLISIFKIIRPINFLITFFTAVVASIICTASSLPVIKIILASVSAGLTASAGNIINDIIDIEIDKINRPTRPLPSGKLTIKGAYALYFICIILSVVLAVLVNTIVLVIVLFTHLVLFLYSKYLKRIPFIGNIIVAFLTGLVFIFGGVIVENSSAAIIPALFAFLINLIRELVKDMQDVEGDRAAGVITFPIKFGFQKTKYLITFITLILILFTLYPFITKLYEIEYVIIVMVIVNPFLVFILKKLFEDDSIRNLKKMSNLLKLNMVFGLIAIYLGV